MGKTMTLQLDESRPYAVNNTDLIADLSDLHQHLPLILKAAARFDELLQGSNRYQIEQAIRDIAAGRGVR
jgi:hypothetical protein